MTRIKSAKAGLSCFRNSKVSSCHNFFKRDNGKPAMPANILLVEDEPAIQELIALI